MKTRLNMNLSIRLATPSDTPTIVSFIHELADYEKMRDQVKVTETLLKTWVFEKKTARVLIAMADETPVGFALFFYHFSTFEGRAGLYIEDIYIQEAYRGLGLGKQLFQTLANIALQEDCARIEWSCLDWNTPSIAFYLSLGAKPMNGWTVYRLEKPAFEGLSKK